MSYWAAAQLQPQRDGLALQYLRQAGLKSTRPGCGSNGRRMAARSRGRRCCFPATCSS